MKLLKNCQAFNADGYRTNKEDLPLSVVDGLIINPWHYNEAIILLRDKFCSSEFKVTAEVKMFCAAWSLFVDSDLLHKKAEKLGGRLVEQDDSDFNKLVEEYAR